MLGFTICSNNYFHHAVVLAKSWWVHHADSKFCIVLVDELSDSVHYDFDSRVLIIPVTTLAVKDLDGLVRQYNITELNTAVKADAFIYLFQKFGVKKVFYIDPDIKIYSPFDEAIEWLDQCNIVVTPHFTTPIDDGKSTSDIKMMGSGLFNLGFLGLSDFDKVLPFLEWWRARLYKYAHYDLPKNMFYDQAWVNYIVVFFDNYHILKHPGYNMANWNFHERVLSPAGENGYLVNGQYPLRFFHFSGYKLSAPDLFAFYHDRFSFATRPDLVEVYRDYRQELLDENAAVLSKIPCTYYEKHKQLKAEAEALAWKQLPAKTKITRKVAAIVRKMIS